MRGPQGIPAWDVLGASFRFRKKEVITTRRTPNPEDFWKFTDEEMETAKNTDLPDLLEHLGYSVRRVGSRYHTTREMDSLMIKDRRTWKRYSNGTGGDAITFLQEFCGKDFREAVNYLLEFNGNRSRDSPAPHSKPAQPEEKPTFALPIPHPDQRRVFAYQGELLYQAESLCVICSSARFKNRPNQKGSRTFLSKKL